MRRRTHRQNTVLHGRLADREAFWLAEAGRIDWICRPKVALDHETPPFSQWFPDGTLNLCANAVDRWAQRTPDARALIWVSAETGGEEMYSFTQLLREVNRWAAVIRALGVGTGDRVVIYMPMIPEAVFAMLACARLGAVHSVVFGGFAAGALAARIDDARPKLMITADAGMRAGKTIAYGPLVDDAMRMASHPPQRLLLVDRGLAPPPGWSHDLATSLLDAHADAWLDPVAVPSAHPSYILYTSGTTGRPKGVQRDTGGHATALAASMERIFFGKPGETFFSTSDIGWVVGHSYIVYGPLIAGMATILYEGTPLHPDPGVLWRLAERFDVRTMFTAPTALRILKKEGGEHVAAAKLPGLKALFVAGEPLDEPTVDWITSLLGVPVIDNYWQTETGWPILTLCQPMAEIPARFGSPGLPVFGFDVRIVDERSGNEVERGEKGVIALALPLPPGCMTTIWNDDDRFVDTYFRSIPGTTLYSTFDWGVQDEDGYTFILGRTDDVINVAGHRLGTREIEEAIAGHPAVAEVAVVGVHDSVRNQVPFALVVAKRADLATAETAHALVALVTREIGGIARPERIHWVESLPKTRSGKIIRRAIQALVEGNDIGDISTIDDPSSITHLREILDADHTSPFRR